MNGTVILSLEHYDELRKSASDLLDYKEVLEYQENRISTFKKLLSSLISELDRRDEMSLNTLTASLKQIERI